MRLLFVHQNLGEFGGAEAYVEMTASWLRDFGHAVGLLYQYPTRRNEQRWKEIFTETTYQLGARGKSEVVETALQEFEPDLVFVNNFADLEVLEQLLASGVPVVKMVHDHSMYCMRSYKYNYFTRKVCTRPASAYCVFPCLGPLQRDRSSTLGVRWASYARKRKEIELNRRCAALLVYSEYQKQELVRNGFEAGRIYLSTPLRAMNSDAPASSLSKRNLVLFAGQVIRGKGVDALLRALAQVSVNFECVILGDGNHRPYCERLCAKLKLGDRVTFKGYVPPAEMEQYYLEASVFAMSSLWPEPFGMVGPEAMRYGLPVVAFETGGIPEWLSHGRNGFLVPWNDTRAYATRLEELLRDKALARRMGKFARQSVQRFDTSTQVVALDRIFAGLCRLDDGRSRALPKVVEASISL